MNTVECSDSSVADVEDPDVVDVLHAAKLQYSGDKVFQMSRRMSGMPLLHRLDKTYVILNSTQTIKFNELLNKFPDPTSIYDQQSSQQTTHTSTTKPSSAGWGSFRGLAERFNVFNKST